MAPILRAAPRALRGERVELTLDPVELGRVRLAVATSGDQVQIHLSIERPETLDLLRRHAEDLRAECRDAGFGGSSLTFGQWGQQGSGAPQPQGPDDTPDLRDPTAPPVPRQMPTDATGLDLRL